MKDGEADSLLAITSPPLCNEAVKMIQTGTSHTAFLTGKIKLFTVSLVTFKDHLKGYFLLMQMKSTFE